MTQQSPLEFAHAFCSHREAATTYIAGCRRQLAVFDALITALIKQRATLEATCSTYQQHMSGRADMVYGQLSAIAQRSDVDQYEVLEALRLLWVQLEGWSTEAMAAVVTTASDLLAYPQDTPVVLQHHPHGNRGWLGRCLARPPYFVWTFQGWSIGFDLPSLTAVPSTFKVALNRLDDASTALQNQHAYVGELAIRARIAELASSASFDAGQIPLVRAAVLGACLDPAMCDQLER